MAQTLPKKPQILGGIMQALYGMSGVEADPTFEDAASRAEGEAMFGAENLTPKNTTRPYKGSGLFGGVKAKGANNAYAGQDALAENAGQRSLRLLPEQLRIQRESEEKAKEVEAARALKAKTIEDARALKARIEEENRVKTGKGAAIGNVMGNLPTEQLMALNAPTSFSSPQEQADWYGAAFGDKPVTDAPATAVKSAQDFAFNSDPATLRNRMDVDYNASLMNLGTGKLKRGTDGKPGIVYNDAGTTKKSTTTPVATGRKTFNPDTGLMDPEYKDVIVNTEEPHNAFINQIENRQMTQDDLNATKNPNVGGGNSNSPVSKPGYQEAVENPFVTPTTNPNPPTPAPAEVTDMQGLLPDAGRAVVGTGKYLAEALEPLIPEAPNIGEELDANLTGLVNFGTSVGDIRKSLIRGPYEKPGVMFKPSMEIFPDAYTEIIRKTLQSLAGPIRTGGNAIGDMINPSRVQEPNSTPLPFPEGVKKKGIGHVRDFKLNDAPSSVVTAPATAATAATAATTPAVNKPAVNKPAVNNTKAKVSAKPAPADPNQELFDMFKKYGYGANVRSSATAPEDLQKLAASMAKQLELGPAFNQDGMLEKDLARVLEMLQQFKSTPNVRIR